MDQKKVLIVGAGPVGLAAALFLSGDPTLSIHIIDQSTEKKSPHASKALLVNPRSLALLSGYHTQQRLIGEAMKVDRIRFTVSGKLAKSDNVPDLLQGKTKFPHLYIYPQHCTEVLLERELQERGIPVARGVALQAILSNSPGQVRVQLTNSPEAVEYQIVLGADGAHSTVRKCLEVPFLGETLKQKIYLADYELMGEPHDCLDIHLGNPEILIMMPVHSKAVRLIANFPDFASHAANAHSLQLGEKIWENSFQLNNRQAKKLNVGAVYLAGDAAHVHAPFGARGMNMGIEDAFVFAHLLRANRLQEYSSLRMPVIKEFLQKMMKASASFEHKKSLARGLLGPILGSFLNDSMVEFASGLDHKIPFLPRL